MHPWLSEALPAFAFPRNTNKLTTTTVPGSSQRFLDKSRLLTADCVAYDLEDSVTPHKKPEARSLVRGALDQPAPEGIRERAVRINSVDSGLALGDLTEVVSFCGHIYMRAWVANVSAQIPQPQHNRHPQSKLRIRPHICHGRDLAHPPSLTLLRVTGASEPNMPPKARAPSHSLVRFPLLSQAPHAAGGHKRGGFAR